MPTQAAVNGITQCKLTGAGGFYLADTATAKRAGTTIIDPLILGEVRKRTTIAPVKLQFVSDGQVFEPRNLQDFREPDAGYHYDIMDNYVAGLTLSGKTLHFKNGVVLGFGYENSLNHGFLIESDPGITSSGLPLRKTHFTHCASIQEQRDKYPLPSYYSLHYVGGEVLDTRFTRMTAPAGATYFLHGNLGPYEMRLRDSELINFKKLFQHRHPGPIPSSAFFLL